MIGAIIQNAGEKKGFLLDIMIVDIIVRPNDICLFSFVGRFDKRMPLMHPSRNPKEMMER